MPAITVQRGAISTFPGKIDQQITDQERVSVGFKYIPDATSIRSYFKRVKYRLGIHHENSYLKLNNQQIKEKEIGISFGEGLPFSRSKSTANFSIEVGQRGTIDYDLIRK